MKIPTLKLTRDAVYETLTWCPPRAKLSGRGGRGTTRQRRCKRFRAWVRSGARPWLDTNGYRLTVKDRLYLPVGAGIIDTTLERNRR